jgi:hypothetical protein
MKRVAICALSVVVGAAVAGCGSTRSAQSLAFTSPTKVTLAKAETGAHVVCRNDRESTMGTVPAPGEQHGFVANLGGNAPGLFLARRSNGSLFVRCDDH